MTKTVEAVALDLKSLYSQTFAGKLSGRFKISKADMKVLAERSVLKNDFVFALMAEMDLEYGLIVISIAGGAYFGVIEESKIDGWRPAPSRLVKRLAETSKDVEK